MQQIYQTDFCDIDLSKLPLVKFKVHKIDPTVEQIKAFSAIREEVYSQLDKETIVLVDATNGIWMNSPARIVMGKEQKIFSDKFVHLMYMSIMVMPNALTKMMLRGVNLVSKPKVPQKIVKTIEEAQVIIDAALKEME